LFKPGFIVKKKAGETLKPNKEIKVYNKYDDNNYKSTVKGLEEELDKCKLLLDIEK